MAGRTTLKGILPGIGASTALSLCIVVIILAWGASDGLALPAQQQQCSAETDVQGLRALDDKEMLRKMLLNPVVQPGLVPVVAFTVSSQYSTADRLTVGEHMDVTVSRHPMWDWTSGASEKYVAKGEWVDASKLGQALKRLQLDSLESIGTGAATFLAKPIYAFHWHDAKADKEVAQVPLATYLLWPARLGVADLSWQGLSDAPDRTETNLVATNSSLKVTIEGAGESRKSAASLALLHWWVSGDYVGVSLSGNYSTPLLMQSGLKFHYNGFIFEVVAVSSTSVKVKSATVGDFLLELYPE